MIHINEEAARILFTLLAVLTLTACNRKTEQACDLISRWLTNPIPTPILIFR